MKIGREIVDNKMVSPEIKFKPYITSFESGNEIKEEDFSPKNNNNITINNVYRDLVESNIIKDSQIEVKNKTVNCLSKEFSCSKNFCESPKNSKSRMRKNLKYNKNTENSVAKQAQNKICNVIQNNNFILNNNNSTNSKHIFYGNAIPEYNNNKNNQKEITEEIKYEEEIKQTLEIGEQTNEAKAKTIKFRFCSSLKKEKEKEKEKEKRKGASHISSKISKNNDINNNNDKTNKISENSNPSSFSMKDEKENEYYLIDLINNNGSDISENEIKRRALFEKLNIRNKSDEINLKFYQEMKYNFMKCFYSIRRSKVNEKLYLLFNTLNNKIEDYFNYLNFIQVSEDVKVFKKLFLQDYQRIILNAVSKPLISLDIEREKEIIKNNENKHSAPRRGAFMKKVSEQNIQEIEDSPISVIQCIDLLFEKSNKDQKENLASESNNFMNDQIINSKIIQMLNEY